MTTLRATVSAFALLAAAAAGAQEADAPRFEATLAGHAALPATTSVSAPADAPQALQTSGKYATEASPARADRAAEQPGQLPMEGQPVQGFSGIRKIDDERYYVLTDNGFGALANSPDAMLMFHVVRPDFETGEVEIEETTFLSDPNEEIPFVIVMEGTETRYLTGADLDLEGFQIVGDEIVIGEEFGPYVISADLEAGVITGFHETYADGELVKSPDHYTLQVPNPDAELPPMRLQRSRGYEGFAKTVDGEHLLGLLEGPLWDADAAAYETVDGNQALRILEIDAETRESTGRHWFYRLAQDGNAIGDFNMIDETRGLVLERDWGQGDPALACGEGESEGCFTTPAGFKRVYMIDFANAEPGGAVEKIGYIDLMDIADPEGVARLGQREDGRFMFPFVTIEDVDRVDEDTIIVANDNNYPFSMGRAVDRPDDNEFILLDAAEFLNARAE